MIFPGFDADTCNGAQMLIPMGRYIPLGVGDPHRRDPGRVLRHLHAHGTTLMLARDVIKGTNEFGLHNAMVS